jgi:hypothetical protein
VNFWNRTKNLSTGETGWFKDKMFKFGGALGFGLELDISGKAFNEAVNQNNVCRQKGGS